MKSRRQPITDSSEELLKAATKAAQASMVWSSSGNMSVRIDNERFFISGSGTSLADLTIDDLSICRIDSDGYEGVQPSIETGLHRAVYYSLPQANAVLHAQPTYATIVACSDLTPPLAVIPESLAYLPRISSVAYHHPGSVELAEAVAGALQQPEPPVVLLLANHGTLAWGRDAAEALLRTETLEFLCKLFIVAKGAQQDLNTLDAKTIESFREHLAQLKKV